MDHELSTDVDYLADRLSPLFKEGKPVAISLLTPDARRKEHLIVLTPGALLGWVRERIVVSVIGQGSAVVALATKREYNRLKKQGIEYCPRISDCVRAGIPAKLATLLVTSIQNLYLQTKESKHATTTSRRTRSTRYPGTRPHRYTQFRE